MKLFDDYYMWEIGPFRCRKSLLWQAWWVQVLNERRAKELVWAML